MLIDDLRPTTLDGVRRLAKQLRKTKGIKHSDALDLAAKAADCMNFRHARRALPLRGVTLSEHYVLLTIYWIDKERRNQFGRETLRIDLSMPIFNLCTKNALKHVRGFGNLRMVAGDHFVCDDIAHSQDYARGRLCAAERSLRFMEQTGLRPSQSLGEEYPKFLDVDKLPNIDHPTYWLDLASGQFVLVDEPYSGVPEALERAAWAARNAWRIEKTSWSGMYNPYNCDLYVAADKRSADFIDDLVAKINAMPDPLISENWPGESSPSWLTFLSPMAKTKQDKRRARCKGMIYPFASKKTVPYSYAPGTSRRRPIGKLGIDGHIEAGRIIKAAMRSEFATYHVYNRMNSLRSDLEDWLGLEIDPGQLDGPEFFEIYYSTEDEDKSFQKTMRSPDDVIAALNGLERKLKDAYPDCAPLRQQLRRIEMSVSIIEKAGKTTQ